MNHGRLLNAALLVLCASLSSLAAAPVAALSSSQSLASAAAELSKAPAATRVAFVEAAVAELAAAHRAAAATARRGAKAKPGDKKRTSWNKGAQAYISSLHSAAAAARDGASVRLVVDRGRTLRVVVGQRPARQFIIAAPRAKGRPALEHAILRRLCAADGCDNAGLTALKGEPPLATVRITAPGTSTIAGSAAPAPLTSYRPTPPAAPPALRLVSALSTGDGLACAQDEVRHHVLYDNACKALLDDTRALVKALHASAKRGVSIEWTMPARPLAKGDNYELAVNGRGDKVSLAMPALGAAPELLVDILPWAHERLFGNFQNLVIRPPSRLVYGAAVAQR